MTIKCLPACNSSKMAYFEPAKPFLNRLSAVVQPDVELTNGSTSTYATSDGIAVALPDGYAVKQRLMHVGDARRDIWDYWGTETDWILLYTDDDIGLKLVGGLGGVNETNLTHGTLVINGVSMTVHRRFYNITAATIITNGMYLKSDTNSSGVTKTSKIWWLYRDNGTDEALLAGGTDAVNIFTPEFLARCTGMAAFRPQDWWEINNFYVNASNASGGSGMQSWGDSSLGRETVLADHGVEARVGWQLTNPVSSGTRFDTRVPKSVVAKLCEYKGMEPHVNVMALDANATYTDLANEINAHYTGKVSVGGLGNEIWNPTGSFRSQRGAAYNYFVNNGLVAYTIAGAVSTDQNEKAFAGCMYKWYKCVMAFKAVMGASRIIPQLEGQEVEAQLGIAYFSPGGCGPQWYQKPGQLDGDMRTVAQLMDDSTWTGGNKSRYCYAPYFFLQDDGGTVYAGAGNAAACEAAGFTSWDFPTIYRYLKNYIDSVNAPAAIYNATSLLATCPNGNVECSNYEGGLDLSIMESMTNAAQDHFIAFCDSIYGTQILDYWYQNCLKNRVKRATYFYQEGFPYGLSPYINTANNNRQKYMRSMSYTRGTGLSGPFA